MMMMVMIMMIMMIMTTTPTPTTTRMIDLISGQTKGGRCAMLVDSTKNSTMYYFNSDITNIIFTTIVTILINQ